MAEWIAPRGQRVIGRDIAKVQFGWPIGYPLCRPLSGGLWEVRAAEFHDDMPIALHAVIKKTRKTPAEEVALAKQRLKEVQSWHARTRT